MRAVADLRITRMSIAYSIQEHLQISGIIARPAVYDLLFSPIDEDIGWRFFQTYVYLLKHAEKIQLIFKSPNENKQKYSISKPKIQFFRYISKPKLLFRIPFPNQKYSISMYIQTKSTTILQSVNFINTNPSAGCSMH